MKDMAINHLSDFWRKSEKLGRCTAGRHGVADFLERNRKRIEGRGLFVGESLYSFGTVNSKTFVLFVILVILWANIQSIPKFEMFQCKGSTFVAF